MCESKRREVERKKELCKRFQTENCALETYKRIVNGNNEAENTVKSIFISRRNFRSAFINGEICLPLLGIVSVPRPLLTS